MKWSALKIFSNSALARYAVIIPLVGWIVVLNGSIIEILNQFLENDNIEIDLTWRIYIFFIGITLISISSLIFTSFSPIEIKKYIDNSEYITDTVNFITEEICINMRNEMDLDNKNLFQNLNVSTFMHKETRIEWLKNNEQVVYNTLYLYFNYLNVKYYYVRLLCFVLFLLGATLTIIPTITAFIWSVQEVWVVFSNFINDVVSTYNIMDILIDM